MLHVCERTIDNYIQRGLLPKPTRFGLREMWHPNVFYGRLSAALLSGRTDADLIEHAGTAAPERGAHADDATRPSCVASGKMRREARLQALNNGSFDV